MNPVQGFARVAIVRYICLSVPVQEAKRISVLIFGVLKPTKTLGCCEGCPSLPPEKN